MWLQSSWFKWVARKRNSYSLILVNIVIMRITTEHHKNVFVMVRRTKLHIDYADKKLCFSTFGNIDGVYIYLCIKLSTNTPKRSATLFLQNDMSFAKSTTIMI